MAYRRMMMRRLFLYACMVLAGGLVIFAIMAHTRTDADILDTTTLKVDSILVEKSARKLHLLRGREIVRTYSVSLGFHPEGHKEIEGDGRTPEGQYFIDGKNPNSQYHLNLGISYPNDADRARAKALGKSAGGDIKIHGLPNGKGILGKAHLLSDWTHGCIALTNQEIEEVYKLVEIGTPILIKP